MMFNEEDENVDEENLDIFEALGVESSPPAERGADLLDAFADDEEEETLTFDAPEKGDDDDVDPFELIGESSTPDGSEEDSFANDTLEALLSDEKNDPGEETPDVNDGDKVDAYRLLLETVWVDNILDPAEVALLLRKREALEIDFTTHLQMVQDIITTDVSGHEEDLANDATALGGIALENGLSKQEWLKAYEWCDALGCGDAFAKGVWGGASAEIDAEVHELLKPLARLLGKN